MIVFGVGFSLHNKMMIYWIVYFSLCEKVSSLSKDRYLLG